ncbi:hypothetical protein AALO_G00228980 [Alosa alosa]|uniref:C2H2-type domain-containing protein n=1 Tax=Alosa alosa TaxID=278164 RepID=A0AAV6FU66_9TELE|nr:zinc finger protein 501 [Alosa alosa]XP_048126333.1 zinc finger protein 501 [Alosa alosa]KAG5266258.1 hypothetical protein AALO_G00228980 [Alosa alosa]
MEDAETELTSSEPEALGADFITVELDTQPIEYVVKWAEVGSKFTISCVKKDSEEGFVPGELKPEPDESFFAHYESVYPECIVEESVEVPPPDEEEMLEDGHSDSDDPTEPGVSQLGHDDDVDDEVMPPPRWRGGGGRTGTRAPKGSGSHACHVCGKCYSHSSSLSRHVQTHGRGGAKAIIAAATAAAAAAAANQHKEEYGKAGEGKKTLACNVCGVRCNGKRLLAIHKKSHKAKRLHTCNLCGKHFNHSSSLSRHRLIHKGKARPGTTSAGTKAPRGAAMVLPELSMALPSMGKPKKKRGGGRVKGGMAVNVGGEKQYQCTQCDKVFRNSTQLSKHQVAHVRQLLNSYTQDSKDPLAKSSDLKIRLKLCSRDKPNYYTLCKKNKRSKAAARARLAAATAAAAAAQAQSRSPDPERPYECLHCDKRFSSTGSLARHENSHAGEKQYTCSICRKSFVRLSNLKQHQQTHASGKLYSCLHCGKTFVHSSSFSRHKKVHSADRAASQGGKQRQRSRPVIDETAPLESDSE